MAQVRDKRPTDWFWMNRSLIDDYGPKIGAYGIAVYALLARHADAQGTAIPSLRYIATKLDLAVNTVQKNLTILELNGLIERRHRHDQAGDFTSTEYVLLDIGAADRGVSPDDTPVSPDDTPVSPDDTQVYHQMIHGVSPDDTEVDPLKKRKKDKDPPLPPQGGEPVYSAGFLQFCKAYPVKRDKHKAWGVWRRKKLEPLADVIVASVEDHKLHDPKWRNGYVKYPAAYLNAGSWTDELDAADPIDAVDEWAATHPDTLAQKESTTCPPMT